MGQPAPGGEEAAWDAHALGKRTVSGRDARVPVAIVLLEGQSWDGLLIAKPTRDPYSPTGCCMDAAIAPHPQTGGISQTAAA